MDNLTMSAIGLVAAVIFLIYFCWKGCQPLLIYPIACIIIFATSGLNIVEGLFTTYASEFGRQAVGGCFLYTTACMFARTMIDNKAAYRIADFLCHIFSPKWGPVIILLVSGLLYTIGLSVGAWALMYPIALAVFQKGGYSEDLCFATIYCGATSWGNGIPGAPTTINALACSILGTEPMGGLIPGVICTAVTIILQCIVLMYIAKRWKKKGRVFTDFERLPKNMDEERKSYPPLLLSILPVIAVPILFNIAKLSLPISMVCGTLVATLITIRQKTLGGWWKTWENGFLEGTSPMLQFCVKGAFGAVLTATPIYAYIIENIGNLNMHPYFVMFFAAMIVSAIVGSATATVSVVASQVDNIISNFPNVPVSRANAMRVIINAGSGFDKLPHNCSNLVVMSMFHTDFKRSYMSGFYVGCICPLIGAIFCVLASFVF